MEAVNASVTKRIAYGRVSASWGYEANDPEFKDQYRGCASWSLQTGGLKSSSIEPASCNFLLNINPKLQLAVVKPFGFIE
jgi:hypothetical protein